MKQEIIEDFRQEEWYKLLLEDCEAIKTEMYFVSRWSIVEGYWNLGKRILEEYGRFKKLGLSEKEIRSYMTRDTSLSDRTIRRAIQFAKKYPDINLIPEGKNISWNKIVNKYLPGKKEKEMKHYINCVINHETKEIIIKEK